MDIEGLFADITAVREESLNVLKEALKRSKHIYHEDAGHGWLKVPKDVVKALGIAEKISGYSYQYMGYAYLEEDQDAVTYFKALFPEGLRSAEFTQFYSMYVSSIQDGDVSRIRDFPRFRP